MQMTDVALGDRTFRVRVLTMGEGDPLLYLHGFDGHPGEAPYIQKLAESHRVIVPELPGYGESTGIEQIDDILDITLYHRALIEAVGFEQVDVIGHSLGGMFAAELAAICPSVVRRLVLVAPFGLWLDEAPIPDLFYLGPSQLQRATWHDAESAASQQAMSRMGSANGTSAADAIITRSGNLAAAGKFLWPLPDRGLAKRLPLIKAPTLIVTGASDRLISAPYGEAFVGKIPGARLANISMAGHVPMAEQPEQFFNAVDAFLASPAKI